MQQPQSLRTCQSGNRATWKQENPETGAPKEKKVDPRENPLRPGQIDTEDTLALWQEEEERAETTETTTAGSEPEKE